MAQAFRPLAGAEACPANLVCCNCGTLAFVKSVTSSFRISNELNARLEEAVRRFKRGKNSLITEALEDYLDKVSRQRFLEEARRQSLLVSGASTEDEDFWLEQADTRGWK